MSTRKPAAACICQIEIQRSTRLAAVPATRLRAIAKVVLSDELVERAEVSIAIVDDAEIHRVNREHLAHDCPTDVISFLYESSRTSASSGEEPSPPKRRGRGLSLEGELVVSGETAMRESARHGLTPGGELALYVVHGLLHLCGYDDLTTPERRVMRRRERELMAALAIS